MGWSPELPTNLTLNLSNYSELYAHSVQDPSDFWAEQARKFLTWTRRWENVVSHNVDEARIEWFKGGKLNASANCLDRHSASQADKIAFYAASEEPESARSMTYGELSRCVNEFAAGLRSLGLEPDDRVMIQLPDCLEAVIATLACSRLGAVHCLVHPGYGRESLAYRTSTCQAKLIITADGHLSEGKAVPLKDKADYAAAACDHVSHVVVLDHCDLKPEMTPARDVFWKDVLHPGETVAPVERDAEDSLFIMFAAPAIGKPRPVVHTHGGYLLWAAMTTAYMFQLQDHDVFWSTPELSRIVGHSFSIYGTLLNGATGVIYEGDLLTPDRHAIWSVVEKIGVTKLCTGAAVLRTMKAAGLDPIVEHDLSSLQIIGTAGEFLTDADEEWFKRHVGGDKLPVVTTWGQVETGGPAMGSWPGINSHAGTGAYPFFGVRPLIFDLDTGEECEYPNQDGALFISDPWPGVARTIFEDHDAYRDAYFSPFPGMFITGEGAKKDEIGRFHITGRIDDVINVAGHRMGAWELEAALGSHPGVAEATAVGFAHPIKGQGIYAFVRLKQSEEKTEQLRRELYHVVNRMIGEMAAPDIIQWADDLPKTRSGKILRRVLQKIAAGCVDGLDDLCTMADPTVVDELIKTRSEAHGLEEHQAKK